MPEATRHTIAVTLVTKHPGDDAEHVDAGQTTLDGQPYGLTDDQALDIALQRLDTSTPGLVRYGAVAVPASDFRRIEARVISAARLD